MPRGRNEGCLARTGPSRRPWRSAVATLLIHALADRRRGTRLLHGRASRRPTGILAPARPFAGLARIAWRTDSLVQPVGHECLPDASGDACGERASGSGRRSGDATWPSHMTSSTSSRRLRCSLWPASPPVVLHPQVHAAGELRWHRREDELAALCESDARRAAVRGCLPFGRGHNGEVSCGQAASSVASERFAQLLSDDYGISRGAIRLVPNPVDLQLF